MCVSIGLSVCLSLSLYIYMCIALSLSLPLPLSPSLSLSLSLLFPPKCHTPQAKHASHIYTGVIAESFLSSCSPKGASPPLECPPPEPSIPLLQPRILVVMPFVAAGKSQRHTTPTLLHLSRLLPLIFFSLPLPGPSEVPFPLLQSSIFGLVGRSIGRSASSASVFYFQFGSHWSRARF